jgi:chemotaxis protein methyltransferase CheR
LLDRLLPEWHDWRVTILATDVNPGFLRKAAAGVYNEWSFRSAPAWLKQKYFKQIAEHSFEILPRIRERVTFAHLNVAQDTYPSLATDTNAMDLILCRNVLMYFAPERAAAAIENFHRSLVDNGWLLVGPSDAPCELFGRFVSVRFEGAIVYRRRDGPPSTPVPAPRTFVPHVDQREEPTDSPPPAVGPVAPLREAVLRTEPAPPPSEQRPAPANEERSTAYMQASALFELGRYRDAAKLLKENSASLYGSAQCLALLARICANLGELAEARSWAEKALATHKLDAGLHYLRAIILQEEGSNEEATASLKRALYLMPDLVMAHFALGNLARHRGKWTEAERHFTNARALLKRHSADEILPHSDGLAAGRLDAIIQSSMAMSGAA